MVVEGPIVEAILAERFANEKTVVETLVVENMVNKKMEVDSLLAKLLGIGDLYNKHTQTVHCFSISVIAILILRHWAEVAEKHFKEQKNISKKRKTMKNKFNPIKSVDFIKRKDVKTLF